MKKRLNGQRGFTLMELMVVIVIVAILAAVAVPLYINYVRDARETEAKGAIGAVVTAEQTYRQVYNTYVVDDLTLPAGDPNKKLNVDLSEALLNWDLTITDAQPTYFVVTAVGKSGRPTEGINLTYRYPPNPSDVDPWHASGGTP